MSPPPGFDLDVRCTKCGRDRDWPDRDKGAGKPVSGSEVVTVEHHEACPQCGTRRVRIDVQIE
jgi:Zn finger protein HypA/HybF involved in hydrogenase expression